MRLNFFLKTLKNMMQLCTFRMNFFCNNIFNFLIVACDACALTFRNVRVGKICIILVFLKEKHLLCSQRLHYLTRNTAIV